MRNRARDHLADAGPGAVEPLLAALSGSGRTRFEASKALVTHRDRRAMPAFLSLLDDPNSEIRWVAAEGLAAIGAPSVEPLLVELTNSDLVEERRRAVHHVLKELKDPDSVRCVAAVLRAFQSDVAHLDVPRVALEALEALRASAK